jgi:oligosaccharide repeat unit polymerase
VPVIPVLLGRELDLFEPVYLFALVSFVYFFWAPLQLQINNASVIAEGIRYDAVMPSVLFYSLLAIIGFYTGYYVYRGALRSAPVYNKLSTATMTKVRRVSLLMLVFFAGLVAIWVYVARIPLSALWVLGDAWYLDWKAQSSGPNIAYLYGAREAIPACLLLVVASRSSKRWHPLMVIVIVAASILFAGMGSRSRVLLVILSIFFFYYLERNKRPRWITIIAVAALLFFFVIGGIGFYRSRTAAIGENPFTAADAVDTFNESTQLIRAAAIVVRWVPSLTDGYLWGQSLLNVLVMPIPRALWPGKAEFGELLELTDYFWTGAAPPMWTIFYTNFSVPGILVGMMILGIISRGVYLHHANRPDDKLAQIILALYLPLLLKILGRGHTSLIFYNVVRVYLPIVVVYFLVRRWGGMEAAKRMTRRSKDKHDLPTRA